MNPRNFAEEGLGTEMGTHDYAVQFATKRNVEDLISAFPRSIFL